VSGQRLTPDLFEKALRMLFYDAGAVWAFEQLMAHNAAMEAALAEAERKLGKAENDIDSLASTVRVIGEEMLAVPGIKSGDRTVILANVRAIVRALARSEAKRKALEDAARAFLQPWMDADEVPYGAFNALGALLPSVPEPAATDVHETVNATVPVNNGPPEGEQP
jgi:hypothetical protein